MIISINWLVAMAAGTLGGTLLLALAGLVTACRAGKRADAVRVAADLAAARLATVESELARASTELADIVAERERTAALPTRPSLREAVALSRHGASTDELVSTCRIGQSEARLIQMLYGTQRTATRAEGEALEA
ncbi:MAG: DUF2802 domain-containing protein [Gammaproteobacteria bacterium]|nr:DUF2802 domain-containing protein [Gammaproteobacteria bacterium]